LTLDAEYLRSVRDRISAASPGPWKSWVEGRDFSSGSSFIETSDGSDIYLSGGSIADQDFIAHARQDIEILLDEIARLTPTSDG